MIRCFAGFELDLATRELRLQGREIALQPKVFELLAYLIEHEQRVVSKDELLEALWPGVIVTESSLQRAVSLARAALKQGGMERAIRTHARCGYRFCSDTEDNTPTMPESGGAAEQADTLYRESRWADAVERYALADTEKALGANALERWAACAQCAGDLARAVTPLERAAIAYSARGDKESAARVTLSLARLQIERMELAVARGCLRRAAHLLSGLPAGNPHGHLAWMNARFALFDGDLSAALEHARRARALGHALQNNDIETMGLLYWGIALQASGKTQLGAEFQDEAAAAVLSGDVSPLIGGIVYCGLISGCCNRGDWRRAEQWTESFSRWCARNKIETFSGACLLHRAEVYAACGELDKAHEELVRSDRLLRLGAPWAIGDAYRLRGDLYLLRGELDKAERAYREAHQNHWDPYPGYAMLLHYRGRTSEAVRGLLRAAELSNWVAGERRGCYLAHAAQLAALSGDIERANSVLAQLDENPSLWEAGAITGQVCRARAEARLAMGETEEAITLLRRAVQVFQEMRVPLETAATRMRLAELFARLQDNDCADLELSSAEAVFRRAGATWFLQQCARLRSEPLAPPKAS